MQKMPKWIFLQSYLLNPTMRDGAICVTKTSLDLFASLLVDCKVMYVRRTAIEQAEVRYVGVLSAENVENYHEIKSTSSYSDSFDLIKGGELNPVPKTLETEDGQAKDSSASS